MKLLRVTTGLPRWRASNFARPVRSRRRSACAILAFVALALIGNFTFSLILDHGPPRFRDPEYGKRFAHLQARLREYPDRPLVLVVGSSRTSMGVRPSVLDRTQPMLFNMSLAGSGPIMHLMAVRRVLADGVKPAAVLLEYWPAFLREDGGYFEEVRIDVNRLRPCDVPLVRDYFHDPAKTEQRMRDLRWVPGYTHRKSLVNQTCASWLPNSQRFDAMFAELDDWGWLPRPGPDVTTPDYRAGGLKAAAGYYVPLFQQYEVTPVADRALRQLVTECRAAGIAVGLVYLPESTGFREFLPPAAKKLADDHLARVRVELNLPLIDGREWIADEWLPDGFHLTPTGAAMFTARLAPEVAATFPELKNASAKRR